MKNERNEIDINLQFEATDFQRKIHQNDRISEVMEYTLLVYRPRRSLNVSTRNVNHFSNPIIWGDFGYTKSALKNTERIDLRVISMGENDNNLAIPIVATGMQMTEIQEI